MTWSEWTLIFILLYLLGGVLVVGLNAYLVARSPFFIKSKLLYIDDERIAFEVSVAKKSPWFNTFIPVRPPAIILRNSNTWYYKDIGVPVQDSDLLRYLWSLEFHIRNKPLVEGEKTN